MQKKVQLNRRFIRMRLAELGETLATISERSELGVATWYRIANNPEWNWKSETLATLAKELQCSPTDLIEAEGYPSPLIAFSSLQLAGKIPAGDPLWQRMTIEEMLKSEPAQDS